VRNSRELILASRPARAPALLGWAAISLWGASCASSAPAQNDWPTFHGGPARCGAARTGSPVAPGPKLRWKFCEQRLLDRRPFTSSPALAGSRAIIGADSYRVYCLDLDTGKLLWKFDTRWPVFSSAAVWGGRVYFGEGLHDNTDCKLYCLDLASGKELWTFQTQSHTESSPTVADGRLYVGAGDDGVYCLDPLTGALHWQHKGPHVDCAPTVDGGRVWVGSGYGFKGILCLSARDGSLIWNKPLPGPAWAAPSLAGGLLYVSVGNGTFTESARTPYGEVRCLRPESGQDVWRFTGVKDAVLSSVAVSDGCAVFGSRDGACYALDSSSGALLWRTEVGSPVLSSPAIAAGCVLFGSDDGKLTCLRLKDGRKLWAVDTSDDVVDFLTNATILSSPAVTGGRTVFGSSNGHVYCLEPADR